MIKSTFFNRFSFYFLKCLKFYIGLISNKTHPSQSLEVISYFVEEMGKIIEERIYNWNSNQMIKKKIHFKIDKSKKILEK